MQHNKVTVPHVFHSPMIVVIVILLLFLNASE